MVQYVLTASLDLAPCRSVDDYEQCASRIQWSNRSAAMGLHDYRDDRVSGVTVTHRTAFMSLRLDSQDRPSTPRSSRIGWT
jgi:hypothetical protein